MARKKARLEIAEPDPLGSRQQSRTKSEAEKQLEADLFGCGDLRPITAPDAPDNADLYHVPDQELFMLDDALPNSNIPHSATPASAPTNAPLWNDDDDQDLTVSLQDSRRLRKLRDTADQDVVGAAEYEHKLRKQFEKVNPTPNWASQARKNAIKRKTEATEHDSSDIINDILRTTSAGLSTAKSRLLPPSEIQVTRCKDANQASVGTAMCSIGFHPNSSLFFTASTDRRLRIFNIDGVHNPVLKILHTPELPFCEAAFHPSGASILLTGQRPFYMNYDLRSGQTIRSPRALWNHQPQSEGEGASMEIFRFSPDGNYLAVGGKRGNVHILSWSLAGAGSQVIGTVKMNSAVKDISFANEGKTLVTVADDAQVYEWDVGTRRCISKWRDDGGFAPCALQADPNDRYLAVGSRSGIVNMYDMTTESRSGPFKTIGNLTTAISTLSFNHDSQLMAMASADKKDALKLVHLPSGTVMSNWPTSNTPCGIVSCLAWERQSRYLAVGNRKGKVLLYSINHYNA